MTLLVRDEVDIVDAQVRYHLERGVDVVVATDNGSSDGTTEVLRGYERDGCLHLTCEPGEVRQREWVARMARVAALELGADWVLHADADEFWWPRFGSIRETLAAVPARWGVVRGLMRQFVPRPETGEPFFERMIARHRSVADVSHLYLANVKVAHRSVADVVVSGGNHDAYGDGLVLLKEWFPFEVLHFPVRSLAQMQEKFSFKSPVPGPHAREFASGPHIQVMQQAIAAEGAEAVFARYLVDDAALERGVEDGTLAVDVRLRDFLRGDSVPDPERSERFPAERGPDAERAFVADVGAFMEHDSSARLRQRISNAERRLRRVERQRAALSPVQALRRAGSRLRGSL